MTDSDASRVYDDEFGYVKELLSHPAGEWVCHYNEDNIQTYKKNGTTENMEIVKCVAVIKGITAEQAFRAFYELQERQRWDATFTNAQVLEDDSERNAFTYLYNVPSQVLKNHREALLERKLGKNFPEMGSIAFVERSVSHTNKPMTAKTTRLYFKTNCMFFQDAETTTSGCKISWVTEMTQNNTPETDVKSFNQPESVIKAMKEFYGSSLY